MTTPLGELVKTRRRDLNLTQEDLADRTGKSQRWVSNLETGDVKRSRIDTLQKLSHALDIPLETLVIAAGMADSDESANRIVRKFSESVSPVTLSGDDPRLPMIDLLDGRSATEVESITSMVRVLIERTGEVWNQPMRVQGKEDVNLPNRRRSA